MYFEGAGHADGLDGVSEKERVKSDFKAFDWAAERMEFAAVEKSAMRQQIRGVV